MHTLQEERVETDLGVEAAIRAPKVFYCSKECALKDGFGHFAIEKVQPRT